MDCYRNACTNLKLKTLFHLFFRPIFFVLQRVRLHTHIPETYKNTHSSNLLLFAAADSVITLNINREPRAKTWKIGGGWGGEGV